jgi:signal transduction histidine kinase
LVQNSALTGLQRVLQLVADQSERLDEFVSRDPRGKKLPQFLHAALPVLEQEHAALMRETSDLHGKIDYIKRIIQAQQEHARTAAMIEDTTVSSIVRDAVQLCGDRLQRHGVDLDLQLRVNPTVRVAKSHLVQVVINLLNNAVDATLAANPEDKRVIVRSQQSPEGRLEIVVRDSGVGIAQEYLQRVFQHGFTTKADGHGFGLHSCAVLLCSMGGAIRAQSDGPGQGAEFIVTLPRSAEFPAPTATAPTNQVSPAAPSAAPPLPTVDSGNDAASAAGVGITV